MSRDAPSEKLFGNRQIMARNLTHSFYGGSATLKGPYLLGNLWICFQGGVLCHRTKGIDWWDEI